MYGLLETWPTILRTGRFVLLITDLEGFNNYILNKSALPDICIMNSFGVGGLPFYCLDDIFLRVKKLILYNPISNFFFYDQGFLFYKSLPKPGVQRYFSMLPDRSFVIQAFTCMAMIHLEWIFDRLNKNFNLGSLFFIVLKENILNA